MAIVFKTVLIVVFFGFIFSLPMTGLAEGVPQTSNLQLLVSQLQNQIKALQDQVLSLQVQLKTTKDEVTTVKSELKLTRSLQRGATGDEVRQLQEFLKKFPDIYPSGLVTGYFGSQTEAAVRKLQEKQGIETIGIVGPKTLEKINGLLSQSAGRLNIIPSGLLTTSEIENKFATTTVITTSTPIIIPTSTTSVATTSNNLNSELSTASTTTAVTSTENVTASPTSSSYTPPSSVTTSPQSQATTTTVVATTTVATTTVDMTSPSTPTNFSASAISPTQINLSWTGSTDNVGIAGYKIYRSGVQIVIIATSTAVATISYSDTNLRASAVYTYNVAAYDAAGNTSVQSSQASATTQANPVVTSAYPTCGQTIKNVPGDYSTIQAAINAANSGDTVKVAAGTYGENITMKSGVCLEGAGIDQTIIGKSGVAGITIYEVSYVIVKNLTVKNSGASNDYGGGVRLFFANNVMLDSCRLTENSVINGGGLYTYDTINLTVNNCLIDNNHAQNLGGVIVGSNSTAAFTNVTISNNTAGGMNGGIGGLIFYGSSLNINKSILWGNSGSVCCGYIGSTNFAISPGANTSHNVSYSDVGGWSGGTNNINVDPQFISTADYHLQATSPAKNMGAYPEGGGSGFLESTVSSLANILESLRSLTISLKNSR